MGRKNEDNYLVELSRKGHQKAFAKLCNKYFLLTCKIAVDIVDDYHIAQDISQEAFIKLYVNLDKLTEPYDVSGWLSSVSKNLALDYVRRQKLHQEKVQQLPDQEYSESFEKDIMLTESQLQVREAFGTLSGNNQETAFLYHIAGKSVEEISSELGISQGAIYSRLRRSRIKLKKELDHLVADQLYQIEQERAFAFIADQKKQGLLRYPFLLYEMSLQTSFNISAFSLSKDHLQDLLVVFEYNKKIFLFFLCNKPQRFSVYLKTIPARLLTGFFGFVCYRDWMLEIIEGYIGRKPEVKNFKIYGLTDVNFAKKIENDLQTEFSQLDSRHRSLLAEYEEKHHRQKALPPEWPGRLDNIVLKRDYGLNDRIFAQIAADKLLALVHLSKNSVKIAETYFWDLEMVWVHPEYQKKDLAGETLQRAVCNELEEKQVYISLRVDKKTVSDITLKSLKKLITDCQFELLNEKYYRIFSD